MIKYCKYYSLTPFFMCFLCVYSYSVGVVEAAPPVAAEDHCSCWDMQARNHHSCCICVCSSFECKSCETFFLIQCSSLERASRSLAKTGFLGGLRGVFFFRLFSVRFLGVPEGTFDAHGALWGSFGDRLGVILVTFWR